MVVEDAEWVDDLGLRGDMRTETVGDLVRKAKVEMDLGVGGYTGILELGRGIGCRTR